MHLFGQNLSRAELLRRVGSFDQVAGLREYVHASGRADGVRAIGVNTGSFSYEVLPGRALDIASASYRGIPIGYMSKSGITHAAFHAKTDPTSFHDSFFAGVLTTCGLHGIGPAAESGGRRVEQHGRVFAIPAEKVAAREEWTDDGCALHVEGEVHHSAFYHEDLVLRRRITSRMGESRLRITDEVENRDFAPSPCLLLYHAQFGFPFLDGDSYLIASPAGSVAARPGTPESAVAAHARFGPPADGVPETCFYHTFRDPASVPGKPGWAGACLFNPNLGERGMGAYVLFDTATLPLLVQWKMLRSREYVCGLEPSTARLEDRSAEETARAALAPLEKRRFSIEIGVAEGEDECRRIVGAQ